MKRPYRPPVNQQMKLGSKVKQWLVGWFQDIYVTNLTAGAPLTVSSAGILQTATAFDSLTIGLTTPLAGTFTELLFQNLGYATHSYGTAHADWQLSTAESECFHLNCTAADQAVNVVVPLKRKMYFVSNGSGQTVTVIAASGTGIAIANGKFAVVYFDGTNVVRLVADT